MIRRFLAIGAMLIFAPQVLWAQTDRLFFAEDKFNFGQIAEDGGVVEHIFKFENRTSKPIVILSVKTSCGCTTSEYSRQPIKAMESGEIKILFDPMNRPGRFSKKIAITTSAAGEQNILYIEGVVMPRKKSIEEQYPFDMGEGVRFSTNFHAFSFVGRGQRRVENIGWINTSQRSVTLDFKPMQSSGLLAIEAPKRLPAGQSGEFRIVYSVPHDSERYGTLDDVFQVLIGSHASRTLFSANAVAVDRFDRADDDMSSPSAIISKKIIKFAEINHSTVASDDSLVLTNDGGSDLIIRAIECNNKALKCSLRVGDRIAAGKSVRIRLTLDASECDYGAWVERLRIITNDPMTPMQSVRITAIVVE